MSLSVYSAWQQLNLCDGISAYKTALGPISDLDLILFTCIRACSAKAKVILYLNGKHILKLVQIRIKWREI